MRVEDIAGRATISVPEAGELLGVSRPSAYVAARQGQIPVLRIGRILRVPVGRFLEMCGFDQTQSPPEEASEGPSTTDYLEVVRDEQDSA